MMITYTGVHVNNGKGAPSVVDISIMLGRMCRYNGACVIYWPVLLHSLAVADFVDPSLEIHALLHDAAETIISDIPRPVKLKEYEDIELKYLHNIYNSLGLKWPSDDVWGKIFLADNDVAYAECELIGPPGIAQRILIRPSDKAVEAVKTYLHFQYPEVMSLDGKYPYLFRKRVFKALEREKDK